MIQNKKLQQVVKGILWEVWDLFEWNCIESNLIEQQSNLIEVNRNSIEVNRISHFFYWFHWIWLIVNWFLQSNLDYSIFSFEDWFE